MPNRAFQTVVLFLTALLATLLVDVPEQARWLGVEFLVLAGATGAVIRVLDRRAERTREGRAAVEHITRIIDAVNPTMQTCGLLAAAGVTLLLGHGWGLYVFAAAVIVVFVDGVVNAWLLLVRLAG